MSEVKSSKATASDAAILEATGQTVAHWFAVLDAFDVKNKGHKAAANHLYDDEGVSYWWAQSLVIRYEQEKGLRLPGQRSDGSFVVNASKTVGVSQERAFEAWASADAWNQWFTSGAQMDFRVGGTYRNNDHDQGVFKRINYPGEKSTRIEFSWENPKHCPGTKVVVEFLAKGPDKTTVAVTHEKLSGPEACAEMKEGWNWALTSLKSWLESGEKVQFEDWKKSLDSERLESGVV